MAKRRTKGEVVIQKARDLLLAARGKHALVYLRREKQIPRLGFGMTIFWFKLCR